MCPGTSCCPGEHLRPHTLPPVSLFKAASTVSLLTLASRVTGLVRDLLMASVFGVSAMTDAFNVAFRIPNLFRRVFGEGAFSQAFVPVLAASKTERGDEGAKALVDHVATLLTWTLVLVCAAGVIGRAADGLGHGQRPQAEPAGLRGRGLMTRWMFPYIGFMSLVALAGGILNTWRKFAVPAASPVLLNLALIVVDRGWARRGSGGWASSRSTRSACGVMVGGVLQLALQIPALRRLGMLPRIGASFGAVRARLGRSGDAQDRQADAAGAAGRQRGADLAAHQHADRLASGDRQRQLDRLMPTG